MSPEPARPRRRSGAALAVVVGTGTGATALSWFVAQHSLLGARWKFIGFLAGWALLWVAGAWAAQRVRPRRLALGAVLVVGLAMRLAAATGTTPSISNDLYRYGWDAHIQLSGVDPYRYPPESAAVAHLRRPQWFPDAAGCAHIGKRPGCTTMNRPDVRTVYPAVAEAWFVVVSVAYPGHSASLPYQVAGALVDEVTIGLLAAGLSALGRDPRRAAWYALSPVPVVEFAGNGHVDGLGAMLVVAAMLALARGRRGLAGFLIGAAAMVKLYPGIAVIAALRRGRLRMLVAAGATVVLTELPHVAVVGWRILGYLPGYLSEEHYGTGSRFLLVGILPLPGRVVTALSVVVVVAVAVWVVRADLPPATGSALLLTVVILVATPVQPWYAVSAAAVGMLVDAPWLVLPALAAEPYYAVVILADPHQVGWGRACYGAAAALVGLAAARRAGVGRPGGAARFSRAGPGSAPPGRYLSP